MLRHLALVAALSLVVAACSSSTEGEACPIEGTYAVTGTVASGDCGEGGDTTYTITATPGEAADYRLEIQGTTGECTLDEVGTCGAQGKCGVTVTDATTPGETGTIQFSWRFSKTGFTGRGIVQLPKAQSLPNGCRGEYDQTATRL